MKFLRSFWVFLLMLGACKAIDRVAHTDTTMAYIGIYNRFDIKGHGIKDSLHYSCFYVIVRNKYGRVLTGRPFTPLNKPHLASCPDTTTDNMLLRPDTLTPFKRSS